MNVYEITSVDDLDPGASWLRSTAHAELWSIGTGTVWTCSDCGTLMTDPESPCPACGFGSELSPDEEAAEWAN